jgi:RNA polymerase sigma-70 factor, ECF subfamily
MGEAEVNAELDELYRRFAPIIYRRCRFLLGNEPDARDALHDVFVKLCGALADFRGDAEILTWIYRIATNVCINRHRRAQLEKRAIDHLHPANATDPRPAMETNELLRRLLERLPDEDVSLLIHAHHDGLSQAQIAAILGISTRMIRKRLNKAESLAKEIVSDLEFWRSRS